MAGIQEAANLYVATVRKWKTQAEKSVVQQGAVSGDQVFVDGRAFGFDSISPNRFATGDVVRVAQTEDPGKVVVLG